MEKIQKLQFYFQILNDVNRLRIIKFINKEERTVSEIVKSTNMSQPLASHHLKILKNSLLVETKRSGPFIYYKLKNVKLLEILGLFEEILPKEKTISDTEPVFCCPDWWKFFSQS